MCREGDAKGESEREAAYRRGRTFLVRGTVSALVRRGAVRLDRRYGIRSGPKCEWRTTCAHHALAIRRLQTYQVKHETERQIFSVCLAVAIPATARGQSAGKSSARARVVTSLYSSMITMDVRGTLQCGEQVQITGRYDTYFGVRTAKAKSVMCAG